MTGSVPCFTAFSLLAVAALIAGCGGGEPAKGAAAPSASRAQSVSGPPTSVSPSVPMPVPTVDPARIKPADFTSKVDNPYFPLVPGTRFRYEAKTDEGVEVNVVEVTRRTKRIRGVPAVVVRDRVLVDGTVTEDTFDWYAQDRAGNVWYLGEDTKEYEDGKVVSTAGSWEAGVDGAQPGIIMKARPEVGDTYRQEFYQGEAEDAAEVLSVTERVTVPFGTFDRVVTTKDYTPLEPNMLEHKYYARGVGLVLSVAVKGGPERLELVGVSK
jgi:hypothetical protein